MGILLKIITDAKQANVAVKKTVDAINKSQQAIKLGVTVNEKQVKDALNRVAKEQAKYQSQLDKLPSQLKNAQSDYATWVNANGKATGKLGLSIKQLGNDLKNIKTPEQFKEWQNSFISIKKQAQALGVTGRTVFGELGNSIRKFGGWLVAGTVFMQTVNAVRDVISNVAELNKALVNLQMATGGNVQETQRLLMSYNQMAKELGATTVQVADSANTFLRQGKSVAETNTLIYDSMVLSKVGMLDSATSAQLLTSAMKGYKVSVQDALGIVDKLSAVDVQAAVDAGGLATAMSETANIASMMGVSMDKLIGYLAVVGEVTQDSMDSIGNSFKTIFTRMSNVKLGKFLDDEGENISNVETILSSLGIKLRSDAGTWRNFGDVLDEVGSKWNTYSGVQKSAIASAFAGTRQQEKFVTLLNNYNSALEYTATAAESAGSAQKKMDAYEQSLEASTNRVTASFEGLSSTLLDTGTYKGVLDFASGFLNTLNDIVKTLGTIPTLIAAISGGMAIAGKSAGWLTPITLSKGTGGGFNVSSIFNKNINSDIASLRAYNQAIDAGLGKGEAFVKYLENSSEAAKEAAISAKGGAVNIGAFSASVSKVGIAAKASAIGMKLLNASINIGIMLAISALIQVAIDWAEAAQKAREATIEAGKALDEEISSIDGYKSKVIELREAIDSGNLSQQETTEKRKELMAIQDEVINKYGSEASSVDVLTDSIDNLSGAFDNLAISAAKTYLNENKQQIEKAVKFLSTKGTLLIDTWRSSLSDADFNQTIKDNLYNIAQSLGGTAKEVFGNLKKGLEVSFTGTAEETLSYLNDFADAIKKARNETVKGSADWLTYDDILNRVASSIKSISEDKTLQDNLNIFNEFVKNEALVNYTSYYKDVLDAQSKFNEAMASGNKDGIAQATEGVETALTAALAAVADDPQYSDALLQFFTTMVEAQSKAIANYNFGNSLKGLLTADTLKDPSGFGNIYQSNLNSLAGLSEEQLKNNLLTNEQATAFRNLSNYASMFGVSVEDLIATLVELGIVQKSTAVDSKNLANALSDIVSNSDLESKLKGYIDTFKDWRSSTGQIQSALEEMSDTFGLSTEDITSNLDLITAYANGDRDAFREALNQQLKLFGIKPSTGGITGAIGSIIKAANNGSTAAAQLLGILQSLGMVKYKMVVVMDPVTNKRKSVQVPVISGNVDVKVSGGGGGGGGGSSSTGNTYLDQLKNQIETQNDILDQQKKPYEEKIELINSEIDAQNKLLDTLKQQSEEEDKKLELQREQEKLANIKNEKIKLYNAQLGKFEWVADPAAVAEQQRVVDDLQRQYDLYLQEKAINATIDALEAEKQAQQDTIDALEAKQELLKEFIDDFGLLDNSIQKNITNWQQLTSAMTTAGIAFKDISGLMPSQSSTGTDNNAKASAITNTLAKGSKGEDVKKLQRALNAMGFKAGSVDGVFGNGTLSALQAFQTASGLATTGILDIATKEKLKLRGYNEGIKNGLIDFTAPIMVHGSSTEPEAIFNYPQLKGISNLLLGNSNNGKSNSTNLGNGVHIHGNVNVYANNVDQLQRELSHLASVNRK